MRRGERKEERKGRRNEKGREVRRNEEGREEGGRK